MKDKPKIGSKVKTNTELDYGHDEILLENSIGKVIEDNDDETVVVLFENKEEWVVQFDDLEFCIE